MLTLYLVSAVIGGVLVAFSAFAGGAHDADADADLELEAGLDVDADVDADLDIDADADADVDADADADVDHDFGHMDVWLAFASIRFWTYAAATFGTTGLLLTWLTGLGDSIVAIASGATGLIAGLAISTTMRLLKLSQSSSTATEADMLGAEGRVLLTVRADDPGKIRVSVKGDVIDLLAISDEAEVLEPETPVLVVAYDNNQARVVRRSALLPETSVADEARA